jgi:hypothetical protein
MQRSSLTGFYDSESFFIFKVIFAEFYSARNWETCFFKIGIFNCQEFVLKTLYFWKVKVVIISIIKGLLWKCAISRLEYSIFERLALEVFYHQQWTSAFQD